ncbi:type VI secretion lipoprotein TssJ [Mesoterricola silvestris]|uniref:type VI secretion lipoprotein TssJ n=1 Tax=Mesoterricola silvestris TaxID=2927979 RepID=UPI00293176B0|nr:type VI secretion lipoprotein TssJ [Mesoterricola silvestris]
MIGAGSVGVGPLACRKAPAPAPQVGPSYAPHGIQLNLKASRDLNQFDGLPHALLLVVYQLNTTNAFNTLAKDPAGVQTLLKATRFDVSVASVDRVFLQPGDTLQMPLDQAQSGIWFAVAAGYFELAPGGATRLLELPMAVRRSKPGPHRIELLLGRDAIQNAQLLKEE